MGDINFALSTDADRFRLADRSTGLSSFVSDFRLEMSLSLSLVSDGLSPSFFESFSGGVPDLSTGAESPFFSRLSRRELLRRLWRDRDRDLDDDECLDRRLLDLDRLLERRRLLESDSEEDGVLRDRRVDTSRRLLLPGRESFR